MGSLLLRTVQGLQPLDLALLTSTRRLLVAAQGICSSAYTVQSDSSSSSDSTPDNSTQQQQQQHHQQQAIESIWDKPYQRRIVRRRPKHITHPQLQRGSTAAATVAAAAAAAGAAGAQTDAVGLLHQLPSSQATHRSSSSSSSSSSDLGPSRGMLNSWTWSTGVNQRAYNPRRQQSSHAELADQDNEVVAEADNRAAAAVEHYQTHTNTQGVMYMAPTRMPIYDLVQHQQQARHLEQQQQWHEQQQQQQQHSSSSPLQINAVHVGGECDFNSFCRDYNFKDRITSTRDHVIVEIDDLSEDKVLIGPEEADKPDQKVMVVFRYGSVIFFNVKQRLREAWLEKLMPYVNVPEWYSSGSDSSSRDAAKPALRTDETKVTIRDMAEWHRLEPDLIVVQALDVGNIRMISHVLGQSVALDYYNSKVDEAIQNFTPYLCDVAKSGQCENLKETRLLQLIADNSLLYTDVVTKIGLLDISQTAWHTDKYCKLWEALRSDYEIEKRFDAINRKLGPMIENAKFLLDIRAEKKSAEAEWIIIGLICAEVAVNLYGHFWL